MFIVKKKIAGKEYYYLRESRRDGEKVRAKTIAYLGKTRKWAEKRMKEFLKEKENKKVMEKEKMGETGKINIEEKKQDKSEKSEIKIGKKVDEITNIASKRGFFFQTASIYGGKAGFFTYGHLGKKLKSNWERLWRESILGLEDNFY